MTLRVDYHALVIIRAAAALADVTGPAAEALRDALACTDPVRLAVIETASSEGPDLRILSSSTEVIQ